MTALIDLVDEDARRRLLQRLRELSELDQLIRERGRQRPAEPPPALAAIATTTEGNSP